MIRMVDRDGDGQVQYSQFKNPRFSGTACTMSFVIAGKVAVTTGGFACGHTTCFRSTVRCGWSTCLLSLSKCPPGVYAFRCIHWE